MRLIPATEIAPSTYNPRVADPNRLAMIRLSLKKLGLVLPIYATGEGEIISGHQRHFVAVDMLGWDVLPVEDMPPMDLNRRKATNILFNRATNDMDRLDLSDNLTERMKEVDVYALAAKIEDKTGDARFPCMHQRMVSVKRLIDANAGRWINYAYKVTKALASYNIVMPMIVRESDLRVVNGIGRLQYYAEQKTTAVPVVFLSDDEAALAEAMLNLLTMDFNIHERYADVLRYNSFRRVWGRRPFGPGSMTWPMTSRSFTFDIHRPAHVKAFRDFFGEPILDFGAGQREDAEALNYAGIKADVFEPYPLTKGTMDIDTALSRKIARDFLAMVAAGKQWSSIFLSGVLNSVPFHEDRRKVLAVISSLCGPQTQFFAYATSVKTTNVKLTQDTTYLYKSANAQLSFALQYEPNVSLGDFRERPKMQKYFAQDEFLTLVGEFWAECEQGLGGSEGRVTAVCKRARPIKKAYLREALEFEFDLPYPDDTRMGLGATAVAAWSERLGVSL